MSTGADPGASSPTVDNGEQPVVLTPEIIKLAVATAHAREGYIQPHEGGIDNRARIEAGFTIVNRAVVEDPNERAAKAVAKSDLVARVFPNLAGPEDWTDQGDPELAQLVYNRIASQVWTDAKPDRSGKIQQMVGKNNGMPEMVLCRTTIGKNQIPAVYVTRSLKCMLLDNSAQMKKELQKRSETYALNLAMWMSRVPEHAEALEKDYRTGMKKALQAGQSVMTLALEETVEIRNTDQ